MKTPYKIETLLIALVNWINKASKKTYILLAKIDERKKDGKCL